MSKSWMQVAMGVALMAMTAAPVHGQAGLAAICNADGRAADLSFTVKDLNGQDVSFSDFKGKVILLDFWATWCGPCKVEIPYFIDFYTRYQAQGLQVLGFDVDDEIPAITEYVERMGMNYPVLVGAGHDDVLEAYGPMPGLPTTVIIGRDGKVCVSHTGLAEKEAFEEAIKALL